MIVIFGRNNHWISRLIRWRTNSQWSHVGIIYGDNVIEARGGVGVVLTPIYEFMHRYTATEERELPGDINKALALIGRPFDTMGLWSIFFRIPWLQDAYAYFCSELVAVAADFADDCDAHAVTQEDVYQHSMFIH